MDTELNPREALAELKARAAAKRGAGFTDAEREERRVEALCGTYQLTDRILTGNVQLEVRAIFDEEQAPGFTDGLLIWLNFHHLPGRTDRELATLAGVNYHELAHVILTPRYKGKLRELIKDDPLFARALNIVEDWRIETQFAALFDRARAYFNVTFRHLIVDHQATTQTPDHMIFLLSAGRLYLTPELRERYRRAFGTAMRGKSRRLELQELIQQGSTHAPDILAKIEAGPHADVLDLEGFDRANEIQRIAHTYVPRAFHRGGVNDAKNAAMLDLAQRMNALMPWELVEELPTIGLPIPSSSVKSGGVTLPAKGHPIPDEMASAAQEAVEELIAQNEAEAEQLRERLKEAGIDPNKVHRLDHEKAGGDPDEFEGGASEGEGQLAEGEGSVSSGEPRPPKVRVDPTQAVVETEGTASKSDVDGHVSGVGSHGSEWEGEGNYTGQLSDETRELLDTLYGDQEGLDAMLNEEVEAELSSARTQTDLRNARRAVAHALGEGLNLDEEDAGQVKPIDGEMRDQRNRMRRDLLVIRSQLEGTHMEDQSTGRINVRSWINRGPSARMHAFRGWLPEETDEAGLEAVGLIDRSGSMSGILDHASKVLWTIASAVQEAEGCVTLIGFADKGKDEVLYSRDRRLDPAHYDSYSSYGGTEITDALHKGRKVLAASPMANKLLFIVTDGGWGDTQQAVKVLRRINADGVFTVLILLGMSLNREKRGCQDVIRANDIDEVARQIKRVIMRIQFEAVRRVQINRGGE